MLKTESAEQSTTVTGDKINSLPVNFGIGAGAIRNPLSFVQLTPGANIGSWNSVTVNGMPSYSFKIIFEGQESSSGLDARVSDESQPSVEAIQEFTLQTSNFAAEFGQVAGGSLTSRSEAELTNFTAAPIAILPTRCSMREFHLPITAKTNTYGQPRTLRLRLLGRRASLDSQSLSGQESYLLLLQSGTVP